MTVREFETYFIRLYLPLGMLALRIVDNADDAEDIVEETFMKAWQAISGGTDREFQFLYLPQCAK